MDKSHKHHAEEKKADTKEYSAESIYVKFFLNDKTNLSC